MNEATRNQNERTGRCLCGAVGFVARDLGNFGVCHCDMCRQWAGSALFAVTVPEASMEIRGGENIATYHSSDWATRSFCRTCGATLWYRYDKTGGEAGEYEVAIGLLDDANGLSLQREIFIDKKPDCYAIEGRHERLTESETLALYGQHVEGA